MAAEKPPVNEVDDEQSMEEILQSIRRIIAEEDEQQTGNESANAEEDVLELTEIFEAPELQGMDTDPRGSDPLAAIDALMAGDPHATAPVAFETPEPVAAPAPAPKPYIPEAIQPEPVYEAEPEHEPEQEEYMIEDTLPPSEYAPLETLISDEVAHVAASSLKAMKDTAIKAAQPKGPALSFRSGTTVEDLILEAVRPMLKEWLDTHLPQTVERIVAREIHRLVEHVEEM